MPRALVGNLLQRGCHILDTVQLLDLIPRERQYLSRSPRQPSQVALTLLRRAARDENLQIGERFDPSDTLDNVGGYGQMLARLQLRQRPVHFLNRRNLSAEHHFRRSRSIVARLLLESLDCLCTRCLQEAARFSSPLSE